jgi:quinol monooxygenase YgiN
MLVVIVDVHVVEEGIEAFRSATLVNAKASLREPAVARFDVLQRREDPARFVLIEAYRNERGPSAHRETEHYKIWRDAVAPLMASPRQSQQFDDAAADEAC